MECTKDSECSMCNIDNNRIMLRNYLEKENLTINDWLMTDVRKSRFETCVC